MVGLQTNLLTNGALNGYLTGIDKDAETLFFRLAEHMAEHDNIKESFKAANIIAWVQRMNRIRRAVQ